MSYHHLVLRHRPIPKVVLLVLALGPLASCGAMSATVEGARGSARPVSDAEVRDALERRGEVARGWLDGATLVVVGRYHEGTYPCLFFPDGSSVMPLARTLQIERVVRGSLARHDFDFSVPSDPDERFPPDFTRKRRYLALLRPTAEGSARLQDPSHMFHEDSALGPEQLVAIVDLDATEEEIAAHARNVRLSRERLAFEFTPERWRALRTSRAEDLETVRLFQAAIVRKELPNLRRREDVHRRFGPPDRTEERDGHIIDRYDFQPHLRRGAPEGTLVGRFDIEYGKEGEVHIYREDFDVFAGGRLRSATYEEKKARGMDWTTVGW